MVGYRLMKNLGFGSIDGQPDGDAGLYWGSACRGVVNSQGAVGDGCPALGLCPHFPLCCRAEGQAEDLPCLHRVPGLIFHLKDLSHHETLQKRSRYSGAGAGWLPLVATNDTSAQMTGNAWHRLHFRMLTTAVPRAWMSFQVRMRAFTSAH